MSPRGQLSLGGFTEIVAEGFKVTTTRAVSAAARFHRGPRWLLQQVPRSLGPGWFYCWHTGGGKIRASVGVATHPLPARTTPSEARRGGARRHSSRLLFAVRGVGRVLFRRQEEERDKLASRQAGHTVVAGMPSRGQSNGLQGPRPRRRRPATAKVAPSFAS